MNTTEKKDWLNDYLGNKDSFYVSSHNSFNAKVELPDSYDISIRFVGNQRMDYEFLLVLIVDSLDLKHLTDNSKVDNFMILFSKKFNKQLHIIIAQKDVSSDIFFTSTKTSDFKKYSSKELRDYFTKINPNITNETGVLKEINKTMNDSFQYWTRNNLSKYITVNDIDAFFISDSIVFILELKRVKEDLKTWLPYIDDISNYKACDKIVKSLESSFNNFRTVAYNIDNDKEVAICVVIGFDHENKYIDLFKEISSPENIFKTPKYFRSTKCRKAKRY